MAVSENDRSAPAGGASTEPTYLALPDIAASLGVPVTRVHQLLRHRRLVGVDRNGATSIPAEFIADGQIVKGLSGTITLLADAGFTDAEIVRWLFEPEPSLVGTAIGSLRAGRTKEVHRRAQSAGF